MLEQRVETKEVLVPVKMTCNMCGQSFNVDDETEFVEIKKMWGYGSDGKDEEVHRSHLCEPCYDKLVASFTVAPEVREYRSGDPMDPFDPEVELRRRQFEEARQKS